jgi:N-acetylneuraminate lyase
MTEARKEQALARELITILSRYVLLPASKAVMAMIDIDCGPVRLPLANISDDNYHKLKSELEEIDFFSTVIR